MRELIWVRRLVEETSVGMKIECNRKERVVSKVFEDNQGTIAMANKPDMTPRTRHLNTKCHHFKENLGIKKDGSGIMIECIKTTEQIADLFTKGLGNKCFMYLRNKLMGWSVAGPNENENENNNES